MGQDYESKLEILENFPFLGGETVALQRLDQYINDKVNLFLLERSLINTFRCIFWGHLLASLNDVTWKLWFFVDSPKP